VEEGSYIWVDGGFPLAALKCPLGTADPTQLWRKGRSGAEVGAEATSMWSVVVRSVPLSGRAAQMVDSVRKADGCSWSASGTWGSTAQTDLPDYFRSLRN